MLFQKQYGHEQIWRQPYDILDAKLKAMFGDSVEARVCRKLEFRISKSRSFARSRNPDFGKVSVISRVNLFKTSVDRGSTDK